MLQGLHALLGVYAGRIAEQHLEHPQRTRIGRVVDGAAAGRPVDHKEVGSAAQEQLHRSVMPACPIKVYHIFVIVFVQNLLEGSLEI